MFKLRKYYYQVIGKDKHILRHYFTCAQNKPDARINFYINMGDTVQSVIRISKKRYHEATQIN